MSGPMAHFDYISDNGVTYVKLFNAAEGAAMGGTTPATSTTYAPRGMKVRYVLAQNATTGRERKIPAPNPADAHWVGGTNTISVLTLGSGTATTLNIKGRVGEKRYARG